MCEREVISKAVLNKLIMSCKGKKEKALCRNGDKCCYLKAGRCMFEHKKQSQQHHQQPQQHHQEPHQKCQHPQQNRQQVLPQQQHLEPEQDHLDQGWKTVQPRQNKSFWSCHLCKQQFRSQTLKQNHNCERHQTPSVSSQRQDTRNMIECRLGVGCHRLRSGLCPLKHVSKHDSSPHRSHLQIKQLWCQFQDSWFKGNSCTFRYFQEGFPQGNPKLNQH